MEIGQSSTAAHNEHSLADLGDAVLVGRQVSCLDLVSSVFKIAFQLAPRLAVVVPFQVGNVLQNKILRLMEQQYSNDILEQISPLRTIQTLLIASFGKRLAGRACTEDIVRWNPLHGYAPNITLRSKIEVLLIQMPEIFVQFACEDADVAETGQAQMEAAKSRKQVNEAHVTLR